MRSHKYYRDEIQVPTHTPGYPKLAPSDSVKSAPAPQQGFITEAHKADTHITQKKMSTTQARIEAFRYGDLDQDALRRCISKEIVMNSLEWNQLSETIYKTFRAWRSDSIGCSLKMVREQKWWPLFVCRLHSYRT